jgi:hypothetical protein
MNRVWAVAFTLATATPAAAQMTSEARPEAVEAMRRLEMMVGEWTGTSTTRLGPDREQTSQVRETAGFRLDGEMLVVEGLGTMDVDGETRVIHHAFGAVTYDAAAGSYRMRSYRAGQGWVDAELVVDGARVQWTLESPAGPIRFIADYSQPGRWIETGEIQRGGQWVQFLKMELDRAETLSN